MAVSGRAPAASLPMATAWPAAIASLLVGVAALVALFWEPSAKAVQIWGSSSAYNHLFLIVPISLYVIWERRATVAHLSPAPDFRAALLALPFVAIWLVAAAADIYEGQQIAVVGLMQALFLAVLGWPVYRMLLFPLLYLWLLVPTGEFLLLPLQKIATVVSTEGLRLSGVPVFMEGIQIQTPTGLYRVAPGCAGLNFLLASLAFSLLFANLIYRGWLKRTAAVVIALTVAVVANWIRIYGIILIDHFTQRQTDIVDDHLLYGWGFFAVVMLAMMWVGLRLRDDAPPTAPAAPAASERAPAARLAAAAVAAVLVAAAGPAYLAYAAGPATSSAALSFRPPADALQPALSAPAIPEWQPQFPSADLVSRTGYRGPDGRPVEVVVAYYRHQGGGREMIGGENRLVDRSAWRRIGGGQAAGSIDGRPVAFADYRVRSGGQTLRLWQVYWIDGQFTASRLQAKLLSAQTRLGFGDARGAAVVLAVEETADAADGDEALRQFLETFSPLGPALASVGR